MPTKGKKSANRTTAVNTRTTSNAIESSVPAPWQKPNVELKPFLGGLDKRHVYVTHIDRHPRNVKRNIFIVPILMNVAIVGLLAWRAKYIAPYYVALLLSFLGRDSPMNVDTANTPFHRLLDMLVARTGNLFLDFVIFRFLGPWPWDFFVGEQSPSFWRSAIGFQDEEIVVRRSRRWDETLPDGWIGQQEDDGSEGATVWKERILPAIDKSWIRAKTGYLMMDKHWDLDFLAMTVATNMVIAGENRLKDFEKQIIAYTENMGWLVWPVWTMDESADDERRQKVVLFKDKLTRMGKESVFFKWIKIVQDESSMAGDLTPERQRTAVLRAKELFESEAIDFEEFWDDLGGLDGMPGLK